VTLASRPIRPTAKPPEAVISALEPLGLDAGPVLRSLLGRVEAAVAHLAITGRVPVRITSECRVDNRTRYPGEVVGVRVAVLSSYVPAYGRLEHHPAWLPASLAPLEVEEDAPLRA
jgi:hypothetical protein